MKLKPDQHQHLADKLMDSGNILLGALVIGQFVEKTIHWSLFIVGFAFYCLLVIITTALRRGG